jgi:hypothetical protein
MFYYTSFENFIREAKFNSIKEAAQYFNISAGTISKLLSGKYNFKNDNTIRTLEYIVLKLNEKIKPKKQITLKEVFPEIIK